MASSPVDADADVQRPTDHLYEYLKQESHARRQGQVFEEELQARLELVREHHNTYSRIAAHFVRLLNESAEESMRAVKQLSEVRDATPYQSLPRYRDPVEPVGLSPSETGAGTHLRGPSSYSPTSSQRRERLMMSERPSRLVVMPASASATKIASTLTLTGRPQIHNKVVQERRMGKEIFEEHRRLAEFAEREERRVSAFIRKSVSQLERTTHDDTKVRNVKDRSKAKLDEERISRVHREALREKHDRIESRTKLLELEKQAATSAIRRLDDTARKAVDNSKQVYNAELHKTAATALAVLEFNDRRRGNMKEAVTKAKCNRSIAKEEFRVQFEKALQVQRKGLHKDEHDASVDYVRSNAAAPAVEVRWPSGILQAPEPVQHSPMRVDQYARLCGVRQGILAQSDVDMQVGDIDCLRHLAPQHWSLLKAAAPDPQWEAMQRVQASVVRGPIHVRWQ